MSGPQLEVLEALARQPLTARALAERRRSDVRTVTLTLNALMRRGLIRVVLAGGRERFETTLKGERRLARERQAVAA